MAYLVTQMFIYLAIALLLGLALGWLIWGNWLMKAAGGKAEAEDTSALSAELARVKAERDEANQALELCRTARANLQTELDALTAAPAAPVVTPASVEPAPVPQGTKPQGIEGPRGGVPDDLKLIKGVGPKLEALLHSLGYYHFDQVAAWSEDELAWVDSNLEGFFGRATRDNWVPQAKVLAEQSV